MPKRSLRTKRIRRNVRKNTLRRNTLRKKNIRRKNMKRKNPSRNNLKRKKTVRRNKYKGGMRLIGTSGNTLSKKDQDNIVNSAMKGTKPPIATNPTRTHKFDYDAEQEAEAVTAADTGFTVEEEIVPEPSRVARVTRFASYPLRLIGRKLSEEDPTLGPGGWAMAAKAFSPM
jgi:hypothetical protein